MTHAPLQVPGSTGTIASLQGGALVVYALVQALLVAYSSHRYVILWRWWRTRGARARAGTPESGEPAGGWPRVTVQLPIYNEPLVVERLIDAVAELDYPRDRLEIQVLDDSSDGTTGLAAGAVARHRRRGVDIRLIHRPSRAGFKAGALAGGLAVARGERIAVFDADFVPGPDFLRRILPRFDDPAVGMVQARWGHLNRHRSPLTAAQAVLLDAHFLLEHPTRMARGLFFNFNGTAGVWRRACIEDAGGWSHDTLTEDLDLSYRAQLRGWRFAFAPDVVAPAELPARIHALKSQQRRWAKGSIQTARKVLPAVLAAPLRRGVRLEAFVHLTANVAYPLLLALGLLLLPVLLGVPAAPAWLVWSIQAAVWLFGVVPTLLFLGAGQRAAGAPWRRVPGDVVLAMLLGIGLSLNNTRAVLEGLGRDHGPWERTPKTGDRGADGPADRGASVPRRSGLSELGLAVYFALFGILAWRGAHHASLPFLALLLAGFGWVATASLGGKRPSRAG